MSKNTKSKNLTTKKTIAPKTTKRPAKRIDPRLAFVHACLDEIIGNDWPGKTNNVMRGLLAGVKWNMVDTAAKKAIFAILMADSTELSGEGEPFDEERRNAIVESLHPRACMWSETEVLDQLAAAGGEA